MMHSCCARTQELRVCDPVYVPNTPRDAQLVLGYVAAVGKDGSRVRIEQSNVYCSLGLSYLKRLFFVGPEATDTVVVVDANISYDLLTEHPVYERDFEILGFHPDRIGGAAIRLEHQGYTLEMVLA